MKPYAEGLNWKIFCGDCREVIPALEEIEVPGKVCHITLTDPPYGIEYLSTHYKHGNPFGRIEQDNVYPVDVVQWCLDLTANAAFFMMGWQTLSDYTSLPRPQNLIVWAKNNWGTGNLVHGYGPRWEAIAFYPLEGHEFINGRPNDVVFADRVPPTDRMHPTEKPVALMSQILQHNKGRVVFDPFMGVGSTLVAALELGRYAIGVDIKEEYCEKAAARCEQEIFVGLSEEIPCEQEEFFLE